MSANERNGEESTDGVATGVEGLGEGSTEVGGRTGGDSSSGGRFGESVGSRSLKVSRDRDEGWLSVNALPTDSALLADGL